MERVLSATAVEVEDAMSTDQSDAQEKRGQKFGLMLTQKSLMELRRLSASIVSFNYLLCQGKEQLI
jgi:hypothetical protein